MTIRQRVSAIRDPDTRSVLAWLAQCPACRGYAIYQAWRAAFDAARHHDCPAAPPVRLNRWRWPVTPVGAWRPR